MKKEYKIGTSAIEQAIATTIVNPLMNSIANTVQDSIDELESLRQKLAVAEDTLEWIALPNAYHNETNINEPYSAKMAREALAKIRGKG